MPAKGNKFKIDKDVAVVGKILSRKQRKRLEMIVEKKKKKENRAELLAALESVQSESLEGIESLSSIQTKGVKRQLMEGKQELKVVDRQNNDQQAPVTVNNLNLKRKRKLQRTKDKSKTPRLTDPNVVDLEIEDSSSSEEESEEASEHEEEDSTEHKEEDSTESGEQENVEEEDNHPKIDVRTRDVSPAPEVVSDSYKPKNMKTVAVERKECVQEARSKLPIIGQEQEVS